MRRHPHNPKFSRRSVLAGLGLTAAAAPFVPLLESAAEGPESPPLRFLVFFHPHGTVRENWLPQGTTTNFTLPTILEPLADFRDRMIVVDGLKVFPSGPEGAPHTVGPAYVFTGSPMLESDDFQHPATGGPHGWASSASIDQVIAQHVGLTTPYRSLELGVQTGGAHPGSRISYAGAAQPLAPEPDPQAMFVRLFGDVGLDEETKGTLAAERLSVIDVVRDELESVETKVSHGDKLKIDAHLDAIRQTEKSLHAGHDCAAPELGDAYNHHDLASMHHLSRQQLDLIVEAFACQITNVASIMYRRGENDHFAYPFLGIDFEHHLTTHAGDSDQAARQTMTSIYRWYAEQLAYLAARLDAIEEPDGSSVLDNTIILWGSEIAKGNTHGWEDMPFVVLGGGGGRLQTNRFHQFPGQNHCRLLVTLANAMGLELSSFGGFDDGAGALPGLLA